MEAISDEEVATWGPRMGGAPGTKDRGYFGKVQRKDGKGFSTELSRSRTDDDTGKTIHYPLIVPTLTHEELHHIVNDGEPTAEHEEKAYAHAKERIAAGKSPFAGKGEQREPPKPTGEAEMEEGFQH